MSFKGDPRFYQIILELGEQFSTLFNNPLKNDPYYEYSISEDIGIPTWQNCLSDFNAETVRLWKDIRSKQDEPIIQRRLSTLILKLIVTKLLLIDRNKIKEKAKGLGANINTKEHWNKAYKDEGGIKTWRDYPSKFAYINENLITAKDCPPNAKILDIGCGPGILLKLIKKSWPSYKLKGIDISNYAISCLKKIKINGEAYSVPPIEELNNSFDVIIACELLEHLDKAERFNTLIEIKRVLKNNSSAKAIISVPDDMLPPYQEKEHRTQYNKESLRKECEDVFANVQIISIESTISSHPNKDGNPRPLAPFLIAVCTQ